MKKIISKTFSALLCMCLLCSVGCKGKEGDSSSSVENVVSSYVLLNAYTLSLNIGETALLETKTDGAESPVWKVENPNVASVVDGTVTALAPGETKIVVSVGEEYAECVVVVKEVLAVGEKLQLNREETTIYVGFDFTLSATILSGTQCVTEGLSVVWSSDNPCVSVADGKITGNSVGAATIKATCNYQGKELTSVCHVTVKEVATPEDYAIVELPSEYFGIMETVEACVFNIGDSKNVEVYLDEVQLDDSYYTIDDGVVTFSADELKELEYGEHSLTVKKDKGGYTKTIIISDYVLRVPEDFNIKLRYANSSDKAYTYSLANDVDFKHDVSKTETDSIDTQNVDKYISTIVDFYGKINGYNHNVANMIVINNQEYSHFIQNLNQGAELKNISFTNAWLTNTTSQGLLGSNAAFLRNVFGTVQNVALDLHYARGTNGWSYSAGLISSCDVNAVIDSCLVNVTLKAEPAAGMFATVARYANNCNITNCFSAINYDNIQQVQDAYSTTTYLETYSTFEQLWSEKGEGWAWAKAMETLLLGK